jgi:CheY-like chemotaxis protein
MPGMTGVELYEYLINGGQAIPTILITAYPDDRVRTGAWTREFSLTSLSPFRRLISLVMLVLLWNLVILKKDCIKICFLACKRQRSAAQEVVLAL